MSVTSVQQIDRSVVERIGNTPLVPLEHLWRDGVRVYGKLEWFNPFGSVKDRPAYWMIHHAEQEGKVQPGRTTLIEPTSGNTGIALAGIARALGYAVEIVIPEKVSEETKAALRRLGANLIETEDDLCPRVGKGTDQSIALAQAMVKGYPDRYFMPNQYENEANYTSHYETTGPEVWRQTDGRVTHFVAGVGTGGTLTGVGDFLKQQNPGVKIVGVEPQKNHHIQGLRNLEESLKPGLLRRRESVVDTWVRTSDEEAFAAVRDLAVKGWFAGPSSGAVLAACIRLIKEGATGTLVAVFGDDGRKFQSVYVPLGVFSEAEFERLRLEAKDLPTAVIPLS